MTDQPKCARDYSLQGTEKVRNGIVEIIHCLGAHMDDIVVIGGMVPTLLVGHLDVRSESTSTLDSDHVGSFDVDVAFSPSVRNEGSYREVAQLLRANDFEVVEKQDGSRKLQQWRQAQLGVTVDFIIEHDDRFAHS